MLSTDEYPYGHDLGAILEGIRTEVLKVTGRMNRDGNPETRFLVGSVLDCNMKVMGLLSRAKALVEDMAHLPAQEQLSTVPLRASDRANCRALR